MHRDKTLRRPRPLAAHQTRHRCQLSRPEDLEAARWALAQLEAGVPAATIAKVLLLENQDGGLFVRYPSHERAQHWIARLRRAFMTMK